MPHTPPTRYWTTDRIMHLILALAGTTVFVLLIRYLTNVLLPFFVACFVAYLLQPVVEWNRRWTHTKGRVVATILTLLELTIVVGLVVYMFLPTVIDDLNMLGSTIKDVTTGHRKLPRFYVAALDYINTYCNPHRLMAMLDGSRIEALLSSGSSLLESSLEVLLDVLGWLLTLIYILFILIDYPQIVRGFKLIIPSCYRPEALKVIHQVQRSMNHYFRGQGEVALFAMVFYCIGFSIVGLPLAIPMGVLVGILYMIPYFQYVTLIPIAAICLICSLGGDVQFWTLMGKCILVYVVSQCICDYIITPHVMGREMGLNPAIILLSLSVWGSLLGIIGMIIALPVTSLIMGYYEQYISNGVRPRRRQSTPEPPSDGLGSGIDDGSY